MSQIVIKTRIKQLLAILMVLGVLLCIFTPSIMVLKQLSRYTVHIMLGYLALGLFFLVLHKQRLMFIALVCCAVLCMFLKSTSLDELRLATPSKDMSIKVAHFNISSGYDDYEQTIQTIRKLDADIVSVQELTPDWDILLKDSLKSMYPYTCKMVTFDIYGLALYSRVPFSEKDTFYCDDIPNIAVKVQYGQSRGVWFVSSYVAPPLFISAYDNLKKQLGVVAQYVNKCDAPVITVGDYNMVPWSNEIQNFRTKAKLNDSRRGFTPTYANGKLSIFDIPIDHIFYTSSMLCTDFETVSNSASKHLGITGMYQFNPEYIYAKKAN